MYNSQAQRRTDSQTMWDAIDKMIALGVPLTPHTYTFIISRYLLSENFEVALQVLMDMTKRGLVPQLKAAQGVILLAAQLGYPRLSLDLIKFFEESAARSLGSEVWMSCLIASAQDLYVSSVLISKSMFYSQTHPGRRRDPMLGYDCPSTQSPP
jgi:pentatricopeptide repeat protein